MFMTNNFAHTGILLRVASGVGLSGDDRESVADGARQLATVRLNIQSGELNPFVGLDAGRKLALLSYLAFMKENACTDMEKGHSPVTDSARKIISDVNLYQSDEKGLTYDLASMLNRMPYILNIMISIEPDGNACVVIGE